LKSSFTQSKYSSCLSIIGMFSTMVACKHESFTCSLCSLYLKAMYEAMQLFLNRNIEPKMGALVIGKMVPCTCPCTASWQIHGHGDRQKKYKNGLLLLLLLLLLPFKAREISDSLCIHVSRRRRKNRGSIFAYHYVLKDKNPVQICPIYIYFTPTKHVFVTSVTGRTLIKCNPGMVFFQLDPCI